MQPYAIGQDLHGNVPVTKRPGCKRQRPNLGANLHQRLWRSDNVHLFAGVQQQHVVSA